MAAAMTAHLPPTGLIDGSSIAVDGFFSIIGALAIVALLTAYAALLVLAIRTTTRSAPASRRLRAGRPGSRPPRPVARLVGREERP